MVVNLLEPNTYYWENAMGCLQYELLGSREDGGSVISVNGCTVRMTPGVDNKYFRVSIQNLELKNNVQVCKLNTIPIQGPESNFSGFLNLIKKGYYIKFIGGKTSVIVVV